MRSGENIDHLFMLAVADGPFGPGRCRVGSMERKRPMLSVGERPRVLKWHHAGPMLFGDWGTSRLYVLGLAFAFNGRASFWFILLMSALLLAVGWSYQVVCKLFPDGGGVYSAARQRSQLLAVVGGLLLCADYVVTASLSCLEAFHYLENLLSLKGSMVLGMPFEAFMAAFTILGIGLLNALGPTKTGSIAMLIAIATVVLTTCIGLSIFGEWAGIVTVPAAAAGFHVASPFQGSIWESWVGFTEIVLALSGVEAIANMTGVMVQPVERTSKLAIRPVMFEIVIMNIVLAAAMHMLPDSLLYYSPGEPLPAHVNVTKEVERGVRLSPEGMPPRHTDDMLHLIAENYVGHAFATVSSFVFALLLLSAVNTALGALVSALFMLSRDRELPSSFGMLNKFGMPLIPLVVASVVPSVVVLLFPDVTALAGLYAVGVVGAIGINLASISTNKKMQLSKTERTTMLILTALMICIETTICQIKPEARGFAMITLAIGLGARLIALALNTRLKLPPNRKSSYIGIAVGLGVAAAGVIALTPFAKILPGWQGNLLDFILATSFVVALAFTSDWAQKREGVHTGIAEGLGEPIEMEPGGKRVRRKMLFEGNYKPINRIMVATQGNPELLEYAIRECQAWQAELQLLFIRHVAVQAIGPIVSITLDEDQTALDLFEEIRKKCEEAGVPLRLLYGVSREVPDSIMDFAVTHGADLLMLGVTRRGAMWTALKGDVLMSIARNLPESIGLLIVGRTGRLGENMPGAHQKSIAARK
jgi:amino acid transporter/nucleotide-binding universal stress UspA family protein